MLVARQRTEPRANLRWPPLRRVVQVAVRNPIRPVIGGQLSRSSLPSLLGPPRPPPHLDASPSSAPGPSSAPEAAACMAMANLSFENAANKVRIVSGGAVEAVVRIIGEETEEAVVFEAAKCLANITCDNRPGQQEVSKAGGVQAMVFLLGRKSLPNTTKQAILGALGNVALNMSMGKPTVVAAAGLMPMIRFISKRKTPLAVVAQAAKALGNTAFGAQAVKARIMAEKAGPPLVARLIESAKLTAAARLQTSQNKVGQKKMMLQNYKKNYRLL